MKQKLVVVIMGQNCERFISMCLEAVKDADAIVFCDGVSIDNTHSILLKYNFGGMHWCGTGTPKNHNKWVIQNKYDQEDREMNGKQRNFYLDYVKKNYPDWWCLVVDADEVVEDLSKIKDFIQVGDSRHIYSPRMIHFIGDLGHEDSTQPVHVVPNRLFKISEDLFYPLLEHPVLQSKKDRKLFGFDGTTIWHLAYIPGMWDIKKRYENHIKKSQMHPPGYLDNWYRSHLIGKYPRKRIDLLTIPRIILKEFGIDIDEIYFLPSVLEAKHFIMTKQWINNQPTSSVLDIGCGLGHYGIVVKYIDSKIEYLGVDKSKWALKHTPHKDLDLRQMDITEGIVLPKSDYDLVLCVDILEHLDKRDLDFVLESVSKLGKHFIFSIPFIGNPDLNNDPTHIIKEEKEWWVKELSKHFKIEDAPKEWLAHEQILVGVKK